MNESMCYILIGTNKVQVSIKASQDILDQLRGSNPEIILQKVKVKSAKKKAK